MRVMSQKQKNIQQKLVGLARGDVLLVQRALRECATAGQAVDLDDIKRYIMQHRVEA